MPTSSSECSPCSGMLALFRRRPRAQQLSQPPKPTLLRRAFGRMTTNRRRRRHRASSFSSVRAVFWPLMSMGSDADRGDVPRSSSADSGGTAVRAPSPSLDTPAATTTAARVLAIQAQLGEAAASTAPAVKTGTKADNDARALPATLDAQAGTAARVLALQARLGSAAVFAAPTTKPNSVAVHRLSDVAAACGGDGDVEDACRGFERQLMEMLVEEAKVGDLMDVEELLGCWENLRSPVFVRLVGRFYGDLCVDLFSGLLDDDVSSDDSTV
uniref:Uncharacterized protein n=1 Tax=Avena sativa TaxID=4498 RepID=A0ACD6ANI1_AVESA